MKKRKKIPKNIVVDVLTRSRRRCCMCYGLKKDDGIKNGQIVHLDKNSSNNSFNNLAFLCLEHHNEYDSSKSQSKGFTITEAKKYRNELYEKFDYWVGNEKSKYLLNFLASTLTYKDMLNGALKVAGTLTLFPESVVKEALTEPRIEYVDFDLWGPILAILEYMESWGWLKFNLEEIEDNKSGLTLVRLTIKHNPLCEELVKLLNRKN